MAPNSAAFFKKAHLMSVHVLTLNNVEKSFGPTKIIRGVTLEIKQNERHALIGPNGAGKSTLFNLISGRLSLSAGQIKLHGNRIDGCAPESINRMGLARSFQITNVFPGLRSVKG